MFLKVYCIRISRIVRCQLSFRGTFSYDADKSFLRLRGDSLSFVYSKIIAAALTVTKLRHITHLYYLICESVECWAVMERRKVDWLFFTCNALNKFCTWVIYPTLAWLPSFLMVRGCLNKLSKLFRQNVSCKSWWKLVERFQSRIWLKITRLYTCSLLARADNPRVQTFDFN